MIIFQVFWLKLSNFQWYYFNLNINSFQLASFEFFNSFVIIIIIHFVLRFDHSDYHHHHHHNYQILVLIAMVLIFILYAIIYHYQHQYYYYCYHLILNLDLNLTPINHYYIKNLLNLLDKLLLIYYYISYIIIIIVNILVINSRLSTHYIMVSFNYIDYFHNNYDFLIFGAQGQRVISIWYKMYIFVHYLCLWYTHSSILLNFGLIPNYQIQ